MLAVLRTRCAAARGRAVMMRTFETILAVIGAALVCTVLTLIVLGEIEQKRQPSQRALETITRYETVINGERIQCERRDDHVRGTTEVAC